MIFPDGFTWGSATSSFQIEGAANAEGKGPSIWDTFCQSSKTIIDGSTAENGVNHYYRFHDDIGLMEKIGIQAYRFSISWPRVIPDGNGKINEAGIAFYEKLVDSLLSRNIEPWVTLFHWDYPQALYEKGGWLDDASPDWFENYVRLVVERLSDRVTHWITLNEPQVFIEYGYKSAQHAPGLQLPFSILLHICHNVLLAHGKGVRTIREHAKKKPIVGVAPVGIITVPADETHDNIQRARSATYGIRQDSCWNNIWFGDPMILGHYPEEGLSLYGNLMPPVSESDMELIRQPIDFYGTNIYTADLARGSEILSPASNNLPQGMEFTQMGWPVIPESLYWGPKFLFERYGLPIVITENGMACHDTPGIDGQVHDQARIDFTSRYLQQLFRACKEGIPCRGYFHWSLLDNFEWAYGYSKRFGLAYVDFKTQERILKDSAIWYSKVINTNGACLGTE